MPTADLHPDEATNALVEARAARGLFGRTAELERIGGLLDAVAERGSALVIRGEAGIGKSTLLAAAAVEARDRGFSILTASGVHSEAELPFAGLHQLLHPILDRAEQLPAPQRTAIESAFGAGDAVAPELFMIALASLNLVADLAATSPVLLVIEESNSLDRPTIDVITFIARRLESDPIVLLAALRDGPESPLDGSGLPEMVLDGLEDDASRALLEATGREFAPAVRDRLVRESEGNPLALRELSAGLARGQLAGAEQLPDRLRLTERLERSFASRISALPEPTRTMLLLAATDDRGVLSELLAAAATMGDARLTAAALEPAVDARLIDVDETMIRFHHPLMRSAVYQVATDRHRRAAHAAFATALEADPDRRITHLAASVIGPSEEAAAELEAAADRARQRGAVVLAVNALERSALLTPEPARRLSRRLRAAALAFELGRNDMVTRILEGVDPSLLEPLDRARIVWIREIVEPGAVGHAARIRQLVETADQTTRDGDPDLALNLLWAAALRCWRSDPGPDLRMRVVGVADAVPVPEDEPRLLMILATAASIERGAVVLERLRGERPDRHSDPSVLRHLGMAATSVGDFALGETFFGAAVSALRGQGRLALLAQALNLHAWTALHSHDLQLAAAHADEGARLARETGQPLWNAGANVTLSTIAAMRGNQEGVDALAAEAERAASSGNGSDVLADLQMGRGLAALGQGLYEQAYEQLRRVFDPADPAYHPMQRCWAIGDFVEAAVHSGHEDEARVLMAEMETLAATTPSPRFQYSMLRARPWLANESDADRLYQTALATDLTRWPFIRARLQLAYGEWLRRHRRVADARVQLRAARDTLDVFGALQWGERVRRELRAAGEMSQRRTRDATDDLTPQELQISRLAAQGLSNREIGEQLYLSHRTIGFHLYRVYPKLGVTSRAELASVLSGSSHQPGLDPAGHVGLQG
jgi:DNA-binding CsgD family transcriptional regulator